MVSIAGLTLIAATPGTISDRDAEVLVRAAFRAVVHASAEEVDRMAASCGPDFVEFESYNFSMGYSRRTGMGAATAEYFVIHRRTGEVWDQADGRLVQGKELKRVQGRLRKRMGVRADEVERVRAMTPACLAGLQATAPTGESEH